MSDLGNASLYNSNLNGTDFTGAVVAGVELGFNLTKEQFYSTASYQAKTLRGVSFSRSPDMLSTGNGPSSMKHLMKARSTQTKLD